MVNITVNQKKRFTGSITMEEAAIPFPFASLFANAETAKRAIEDAVSNPISGQIFRCNYRRSTFLGQKVRQQDTSRCAEFTPGRVAKVWHTFHGVSTTLVTGARILIRIVECW